MIESYTLLTGATGLLGGYLLRDLLRTGVPVAVLVRGRRHQPAADRVETVVARWEHELGRALPRPVVLSGALHKPGLGLSAEQTVWLRHHCGRVLHAAASLKFAADDQSREPGLTNVEGTRHLLDCCRDIGLREFHHVSTAYVAGLRTGIVREDELDVGQNRANAYEETKAAAEHLVCGSGFLDSATVYRPSIIVGDSRTGYTSTFQGFYTPLRVGAALCPKLPASPADRFDFLALFGLQGEECKNLVPVDWVAAAIIRILARPEHHGRPYHLTAPAPVTVRDLQDVYWEVLRPLVGRDPVAVTATALADLAGSLLGQLEVYRSYWRNDPTFDRANTETALPDLPCPVLDRDRLLGLARWALDARFSPPRRKLVHRRHQARDWLARVSVTPRPVTGSVAGPLAVGLELTGQGGAAWQFEVRDGRLGRGGPGLPPDPAVTFHLPWTTFEELTTGRLGAAEALETGRALAIGEQPPATRELAELLAAVAAPPNP
ncbi:SDR family oxidoreductase [bacterium]|nr:SDR family oxidoreductase [bacterium]